MYLGIDLGTSSVKLVLIDEKQEIIAQNSQHLHVSQPKPLWSEQNPQHWWHATCDAIQVLRKSHPKQFAAIKGIGLSGQQHGATLLDEHNNVLRPAMLWNDGRAYLECQRLIAEIPDFAKITGSLPMTGFTAPKLLWVAQHEPDIFQFVAKVLLPKDYLRLRMTGEYATDLSDASGTGWLDVGKRRWSDKLLQATGLSQSHMPKLFEGSEITGTVSKAIADEWGISPQTVVVGGGGDNPAGAISLNVIKSGTAFLSLGTSGVYFVASDRFQANPQGGVHTFCHCIPNSWHHMSVHLSAASCLTWLANTFNTSPEELVHEAEASADEEERVIFLPYLSGERTPHINPHARGVFFGLSHTTKRADLTRAVLEGVAFAFADGQDAILQAGVNIEEISAVGGGTQSLYWGKILATVLNRPLVFRRNREIGAALGVARLAWLSANPRDPLTAFTTPAIEKVIEPDYTLLEDYAAKREVFRKLYQNLRDVFKVHSPF